ncbi:MAG: FAD-linked oxidase C-terminal domain-containing protein [Nocardioides sp.]
MSDLVEQLRAAVGERVLSEPDSTAGYRHDQCMLAPAGEPAAVVRAAGVEDVQATLRVAHRAGVPVVTRGAGSGLAGGANALDGGIVLSLAGMDRILDLDVAGRTARVQAGVINADLDAAARRHGLWYAPDPGSRAISTLGGNLATNAGGMCCTKYGVTADHVASLTAVLADGRVIETGSTTRKNVAGLDLTRLLVGSEGTLAVIVEAELRLRPVPAGVATVVAEFPTVEAAIDAVVACGGVTQPAVVELMDATTVRAVNEMTHMGLDEESGALLLIQCDGSTAASETETCERIALAAGATEVYRSDDEDDAAALMEARRVALTALERLGTVLLDDVAVPVARLAQLLGRIQSTAAEHRVLIGTFGHAADGNLHPTIVFDPTDPGARERAGAAFDDIVAAALDLGGTLSGEHGVGVLKTAHLERMVGRTERELMTGIKQVFDPTGILNPGRAY